MVNCVAKNYFDDGGDTLVIGGKLVVEEGATIEGLDIGGGQTIDPATTDTYGLVKQGVAVADSVGSNVLALEGKLNELLGSLRTAGVIASE